MKRRSEFKMNSSSEFVEFEKILFKYRHILVVTPTRANKAEINSRLDSAHISRLRRYVKVATLDSALLNVKDRGEEYSAIIFDEAPMCHVGAMFLLIYVTKAKIVYLLGDRKQINFVNR